MRTKLWILGAALGLLSAASTNALKVYKVSSEGLADIKVYVSDSKGQADCVIHVETSAGLATGNARWFYENSAGVADVNMYFTDSAGLADKTIFFTNSEGLARCDVDWRSFKKQRASAFLSEPKGLTRGPEDCARGSGPPGYDATLDHRLL